MEGAPVTQLSAAGAARLLLAGTGNPGANAPEPLAKVLARLTPELPSLVHHLLEPGWAAVRAVFPSSSLQPLIIPARGLRGKLSSLSKPVLPGQTLVHTILNYIFKACMIFRFGAINLQKELPQMKVLKWLMVHAGAKVSSEAYSFANGIKVFLLKVFEISFISVI